MSDFLFTNALRPRQHALRQVVARDLRDPPCLERASPVHGQLTREPLVVPAAGPRPRDGSRPPVYFIDLPRIQIRSSELRPARVVGHVADALVRVPELLAAS